MVEDIQSGISRDDVAAVKRIIARLPELQAQAEAIGAESVAAWLERALEAATALIVGQDSTELH